MFFLVCAWQIKKNSFPKDLTFDVVYNEMEIGCNLHIRSRTGFWFCR